MTTTPLNETAALERHGGGERAAGHDLATANRDGIAAYMESSQTIEWAQRLAVLLPIFERVVDTPFVPDSYWPMPEGMSRSSGWPPQLKAKNETPEQYLMRRRSAAGALAVAAMWGEKYGWDPPRSWRGLYVVHGSVNLYAEAVNDLCRRNGVGLEIVKREADEAVIRLRRPEPDAEWHEYSFTMKDAERAGYVPGKGPNAGRDSKGGNAKYDTDPKTMLFARVLTIGARLEIPDILGGAGVAETADDGDLAAARDVTVTSSAEPAGGEAVAAARGSARLRDVMTRAEPPSSPDDVPAAAAPQAPPEADQSEAADQPEAVSEPTDRITPVQAKRITTRLDSLGVRSGDEKLAVISHMVGRGITRMGELAADEAPSIVSRLVGDKGREEVDAALHPATEEPEAVEPDAEPDAEPPAVVSSASTVDPWGINPAGEGEER